MASDSFGARSQLVVGDRQVEIFRLDVFPNLARLPYSIKVLLENLLRHEDGRAVSSEDVGALAAWVPESAGRRELMFFPERVLMQDFTGVPAAVDLAAMRDAVVRLGGDPTRINPVIPVELVIDHSVIAEVSGRSDAFARNAAVEATRNIERYKLLRWAQQSFDNFSVIPPDTGICHQVNLEYLARVIFDDQGRAYPDTLVGTDSHTPMVNGLGVLGWGVGGIEAEAAMLGQPISMLVPAVVGLRLVGELPEGATSTDLVLVIAELLRQVGVVGKLVECYGPALASIPVETRATIGNMSPEYGAIATMSPIDDATLAYLRMTGRDPIHVALVEAYAKEQGLFHNSGDDDPTYSEIVELDLNQIVPCLAGPARPQDRIPLTRAKQSLRVALASQHPSLANRAPVPLNHIDEASAESFPASDSPTAIPVGPPRDPAGDGKRLATYEDRDEPPYPSRPTKALLEGGAEVALDHGAIVIAAITSCTNTSNPQVMVAAGLVARRAVELGLRPKPWVKTSLAPGSRVVIDYFRKAGLLEPLETLGFNLVGYGCTTCIGNSGPLLAGVSAAVADGELAVCAVLSGNRNFEGRIHSEVRLNYLASPPLVVAYALAGTMDIDLTTESLGVSTDGRPVYLSDLWPSLSEVDHVVQEAVGAGMFHSAYASIFEGDARWQALITASATTFDWDAASTYISAPPFFEGMESEPAPPRDIVGARVLALLGNSVTTDHISPAGAIRPDSPAGRWLTERGVAVTDFNSYGARRGNHHVMLRGTFANPRLRNLLTPETEGGVTLHLPDNEKDSIFAVAERYRADGVPLLVVAGRDYGAGSSRDWAAKGTLLLGVRAVLAESFERIHRSNLIGMGVLPLELPASAAALGLSGRETYAVLGLDSLAESSVPEKVGVRADSVTFQARVRLDTPMELAYYLHGGILPFMLRGLPPP
ncbi:MAG TPA: aconitate hydratase [Candidatus Dormibacteraeota bacterium]|nr:aconitate hydratase [Candidatus Dormibacteraeota bacterium]